MLGASCAVPGCRCRSGARCLVPACRLAVVASRAAWEREGWLGWWTKRQIGGGSQRFGTVHRGCSCCEPYGSSVRPWVALSRRGSRTNSGDRPRLGCFDVLRFPRSRRPRGSPQGWCVPPTAWCMSTHGNPTTAPVFGICTQSKRPEAVWIPRAGVAPESWWRSRKLVRVARLVRILGGGADPESW